MIDVDPNEAVFPNNVVECMALGMQSIDADVEVFCRPLSNTDPAQSIGVFARAWDPQDESIEMLGRLDPGFQMPTLQRYILGIQGFVKDGDRERGLAVHSVMGQRIRSVLYTYQPLRLALAGLSAELQGGLVENLKRWGVSTARYYSGEIDNTFLYLVTTELWVETEIRKVR